MKVVKEDYSNPYADIFTYQLEESEVEKIPFADSFIEVYKYKGEYGEKLEYVKRDADGIPTCEIYHSRGE